MKDINELKSHFILQIEKDFNNPTICSVTTEAWQSGLDLLFELVKFPMGEEGASLYHHFLNALEDVLFDKSTDYNALSSFVDYLEKYLALVGHFTHKNTDIKKVTKKQLTLMPLIRGLLLENQKIDCYAREHIDKFQGQPKFLEHICRAYCTRNEIDHCNEHGPLPTWAHEQVTIIQNRNSILIVLVYATVLHQHTLQQALEEQRLSQQPDIHPYLSELMDQFKKWQYRFVALQSIEKIELYAYEIIDDSEEQRARSGDIEQLRATIPELQFMLIGEAGMGKTTTLQYLAFGDAQQCWADSTANIPLYLPLNVFTGDRTLWQELIAKLPFTPDFSEQLFKDGKINVFLDGLNEVTQVNRKRIINDIQAFIIRYPKVRLILAGREDRQFKTKEDSKLPIFVVKKMNPNQIQQFLVKNTDHVPTQTLIQETINTNQVIANLLQIPLMLFIMIQVIRKTQKIPAHLGELLDEFVASIYQREQDKDANFPSQNFHALMAHLGLRIVELYDSNAAIEREQALKLLREKKDADGLTVDLSYILKVATELSILIQNGSQYSFAHEQYLDYYVEQGFEL